MDYLGRHGQDVRALRSIKLCDQRSPIPLIVLTGALEVATVGVEEGGVLFFTDGILSDIA